MEQYILVNGKIDVVMAEALKYGLMAVFLKAIGQIIWLMDKEGLYMQTVMCTRETGRMIAHMEKGSIRILMEQTIPGNGSKINNMGTG